MTKEDGMTQQASWYDDPDPYAEHLAELDDDGDDGEDYRRDPAWA